MNKITISFFEVREAWQRELIARAFPSSHYAVRLTADKLTLDNAEQYGDSDALSIFIHCQITEAVLAKFSKLRFIATNSTGYDHVDLAACRRRNIAVANVPYYGENTVAEHTFALILAIGRRIVESVNRTRRGHFTLEGLRGFDLKGKTIGVVGTGHIGRHVIRIAHGFEMKILAFDAYPDKSLESHYPLQYVTLENLLSGSDVITLHAPYTKQTHHLINAKNLNSVKPGAILINTARGGLVETMGLLAALKSGQLAGAGLDVLEEEGVISEDSGLIEGYLEREKLATVLQDHRLLAMDNVLITPHNAFNSEEAVLRILHTTIENLKAWERGRPVNVVTSG